MTHTEHTTLKDGGTKEPGGLFPCSVAQCSTKKRMRRLVVVFCTHRTWYLIGPFWTEIELSLLITPSIR